MRNFIEISAMVFVTLLLIVTITLLVMVASNDHEDKCSGPISNYQAGVCKGREEARR